MGDIFQGFKVLFKWKANYVGGKQTMWVYPTSSATFSKGLRFNINGKQTMLVESKLCGLSHYRGGKQTM